MNMVFLSFILLISTSISSMASSRVIVTAEKIVLNQDKTNSNVEIISEEEIKSSGENSLTELLERKSSLSISSNGAFGKASSIYLRGADSSYTLIVVDGIEYNDKSSVGGAAILEHIELSSIEKIEILKGSQSVLYGSDALAGVIRITTKTAGQSIGSTGSVAYGSYDNKIISFNTSQKGDFLNYSMGLSLQDVEGISSYNSKRVLLAEKDGLSNLTANFKAKKRISNTDTLEFNLRGVKAESDFDSSTGDKIDYMGRDSQVISGVKYKRIMGEYWIPELSLSFNKSDRLSNSFSLTRLVSETKKIELLNSFYLNEEITLLNGIEYEDIEASISSIYNKKSFYSFATYIDSHFVFDQITFQAGTRWTKEKELSNQITWKFGVGYKIFKDTHLKINASTGFKSPSLYQLYSSFGDKDLLSTKSKSYDFGITQNIFNTQFSIIFFHNTYKNVIDFESTLNKYSNTFKTESRGLELDWRVRLKRFEINSSATLLNAVNMSSGSEGVYLARRPRQKYSINTRYNLNEKISSDLSYIYMGQRENSDYDNIVLSSYSLVTLKFQYVFSPGHELILKLDNLLNKEYEEVHGFGTVGRNYLLRYSFRM